MPRFVLWRNAAERKKTFAGCIPFRKYGAAERCAGPGNVVKAMRPSASFVRGQQWDLIVRIIDDERAEGVLFKQEGIDDERIELRAPAFHNDVPGGFVVEGGLVHPFGDQRVVDVGQCYYLSGNRNFVAFESIGVASPARPRG